MILVEALLFDLDGTLVDSKRDLALSVQFLQKKYGVAKSSDDVVATYIGDGVVKLVQRALPHIPATALNGAVAAFKEFYAAHCLDHTRLYPGVLRMLKHFRGKKMAVVTNKPFRISGYMLDQLGLSSYFHILIGGDSLPNKKPHPEPILNAMATMEVRHAKRVVIIGDSANDIKAGRAAGIRTCGVKSNIGDIQNLLNSKPDFVVENLVKLTHIFR